LAYNLTPDDLGERLREQVRFLERSADAFDRGFEDEAKRLAVVIRVLLHDTSSSRSLLELLGAKSTLKFLDTASPIWPDNLLATPGLIVFRSEMNQESGMEIRYEAPLHNSIRKASKPFAPWWEDPVTKDQQGELFSRQDYVLTVANKEGGAHVDPTLNAEWTRLTRDNSLAFTETSSRGVDLPMGDPALPTVRQIAWEVDQTIRSQLAHLL
jgi:hypothetical protein